MTRPSTPLRWPRCRPSCATLVLALLMGLRRHAGRPLGGAGMAAAGLPGAARRLGRPPQRAELAAQPGPRAAKCRPVRAVVGHQPLDPAAAALRGLAGGGAGGVRAVAPGAANAKRGGGHAGRRAAGRPPGGDGLDAFAARTYRVVACLPALARPRAVGGAAHAARAADPCTGPDRWPLALFSAELAVGLAAELACCWPAGADAGLARRGGGRPGLPRAHRRRDRPDGPERLRGRRVGTVLGVAALSGAVGAAGAGHRQLPGPARRARRETAQRALALFASGLQTADAPGR